MSLSNNLLETKGQFHRAEKSAERVQRDEELGTKLGTQQAPSLKAKVHPLMPELCDTCEQSLQLHTRTNACAHTCMCVYCM